MIQKLRELPIFDVCDKLGITLYGRGNVSRRAECWYHDDQHPSMHVNKVKNICKCFVCGKGGDVIRMVQDHENLSFVEACDWLVKEYGIAVVDKNQKKKKAAKPAKKQETPSSSNYQPTAFNPLPADLVTQSLGVNSEFCQALVSQGYMTEQQMLYAAELYRLGMTKEGSVIFWEIDQHGQCHNGKMMHYLPNCHRDKQRNPTWAAAELKKAGFLPSNFENPHCLFGEHLLSLREEQKCRVESNVKVNGYGLTVKEPKAKSQQPKADSIGSSELCSKVESPELKDNVQSSMFNVQSDEGQQPKCAQRPTLNFQLAQSALNSQLDERPIANSQWPTAESQFQKVAVVESEKTALICSVLFPSAVWLSCGGLQMLKAELLAPLAGYKVILFPDTDEKGDAYQAWLAVAQEAQKRYTFQYPLRISSLLELRATAEQKARKIDIVDYLFEGGG